MAVARRRRAAEMSEGEARWVLFPAIKRPLKTPPGEATLLEGSA